MDKMHLEHYSTEMGGAETRARYYVVERHARVAFDAVTRATDFANRYARRCHLNVIRVTGGIQNHWTDNPYPMKNGIISQIVYCEIEGVDLPRATCARLADVFLRAYRRYMKEGQS